MDIKKIVYRNTEDAADRSSGVDRRHFGRRCKKVVDAGQRYIGIVGYVLEDCITDKVDISRLGTEPVLFTVTAYCSCRICCGNYSPEVTGRESHTSTGTVPQQGRTIAVDPRVIPYGTSVHIDGLGDFIAEDCGGNIRQNHIDVYFASHAEAVAFGSKRLYVTINH